MLLARTTLPHVLILLLLLPLLVPVLAVQSKINGARAGWLKRVTDPRGPGCWNRPWICNQGERPPRIRRLCCMNRCVDVSSDANNCGLCGIRCPFTWQCCRGLCFDTNINPFHCGRCETRCPFLTSCYYGMCGYATPLPPFPFPLPPRPPYPFPFPPDPRPPKPHPPKPQPPPHPPHGLFPPHGPHTPPGQQEEGGQTDR